jgi:hypothetical protein
VNQCSDLFGWQIFVQHCQHQRKSNAGHLEGCVCLEKTVQPFALLLGIDLAKWLMLRQQKILLQAGDFAIIARFFAFVNRLGGFGQDFDNHGC